MKNLIAFLKSRVFLINLGIAIGGLFLLLWIVFGWMRVYTRHGETVDVPDFKDQKVVQLDAFIKGKSVNYEIIDSIWDPKKTKGIVLRQDPEPGSKVKENRKIYLYVTATQPPQMGMPQLENLSLRQAEYVCESYGLRTQIKYVDAPCEGCVVQQRFKGKRIETNTPIDKGSLIELFIGKGENNSAGDIKVPNLIGMTFRSARGKLIDLDLEWMLIPDAGVKDTLNAIIYEQTPAPDSDRRIVPGATIDLRVSVTSKSEPDPVKTDDPE